MPSRTGTGPSWRTVLYGASALAAVGSLLMFAFVREGPYRSPLAPLALGPAFGIWSMRCLRDRPESVRLASGRR